MDPFRLGEKKKVMGESGKNTGSSSPTRHGRKRVKIKIHFGDLKDLHYAEKSLSLEA